MESLRKLRSKVFTKKSPTLLTDKVISPPKKPRDKTLRHSRSVPLQNFANFEETYARPRPTYKGQQPLKASDVHLVVDSRGYPETPLQHPAFDPVVEQCSFETSIQKSSHADILKQFPAPPIDKPLPRRPKNPAPFLDLYDDLLPPNPAFESQELLDTIRALDNCESYGHLTVEKCQPATSSSRYRGVVQPQTWAETTVFLDAYHGQKDGSKTLMTHSNYSTKSLGANVRLKDGPARRVVVNQPARYASRPRMHSGASSGSIVDATLPISSRRHGHVMEPRQRQVSNASTATAQAAEFGYISRADSHYRGTPSRAPPRPPKSPYRS